MTYGQPVTTVDLRGAIERRRAARRYEPLFALDTEVFLLALDHRMNSNTVLAAFAHPRLSTDPAQAFAAWLDDGAPGLARAAGACDQEGHFEHLTPGAAPPLTEVPAAAFIASLEAMLTTSTSLYRRDVVDAPAILEGFLEAEFPRGLSGHRFFQVDTEALGARTDYFDHMGNDHCLLWCGGSSASVLFTNGSP